MFPVYKFLNITLWYFQGFPTCIHLDNLGVFPKFLHFTMGYAQLMRKIFNNSRNWYFSNFSNVWAFSTTQFHIGLNWILAILAIIGIKIAKICQNIDLQTQHQMCFPTIYHMTKWLKLEILLDGGWKWVRGPERPPTNPLPPPPPHHHPWTFLSPSFNWKKYHGCNLSTYIKDSKNV